MKITIQILIILSVSIVMINAASMLHRHKGTHTHKQRVHTQKKSQELSEREKAKKGSKKQDEDDAPAGPSEEGSSTDASEDSSGPRDTGLGDENSWQNSGATVEKEDDCDIWDDGVIKKDYKRKEYTAGYKATIMNKIAFSVGPSGKLFENKLNTLYKDKYIEEAGDLWKSWEDNGEKIDKKCIYKSFTDYIWTMKTDPEETAAEVLQIYDLEEKGYLNCKETEWMAIDATSAYKSSNKCTHCLSGLRKELGGFFEMADCNDDGQIGSEELHKALNKLTGKKVLPVETNDFVLKADPKRLGFIKKPLFIKGVLRGLLEQFVSETGLIGKGRK